MEKVCATLIQSKMSRCFCHSAQTHAQHFLSRRTNTSSQKHFQMLTVNVLPTSHQHTLYFGVRVCVLSAAEPDGRLRHTAQSQDDHGHQQTGHSGPSLVAARKTGS